MSRVISDQDEHFTGKGVRVNSFHNLSTWLACSDYYNYRMYDPSLKNTCLLHESQFTATVFKSTELMSARSRT